MKIKKLLKNTSLAILLMATTNGSFSQPVFAKDTSTYRTFAVQDSTTGIESTITIPKSTNNKEDLSLEEVSTTTGSAVKIPSKITPKIIFDNSIIKVRNTTVEPYNSICYLESKFPDGTILKGTAWINEDNVAITAGHCLYSEEYGGWAKTVTVWPGREGNTMPYGSAIARFNAVPDEFKDSKDRKYDYGIITLDSDIGTKCGHLQDTRVDKYVNGDYKMTIAGYPDLDKDKFSDIMYKASGYPTDYDDQLIECKIDGDSGESGSPIFIKNDSDHYRAVGIYVGGTSSKNGDPLYNDGVRITAELQDAIKQMKNK